MTSQNISEPLILTENKAFLATLHTSNLDEVLQDKRPKNNRDNIKNCKDQSREYKDNRR